MKWFVSVSFLSLLLAFSPAAVPQAEGTYSGSWFNPSRDGEGFHIQLLADGRALVIWFTYPGSSDNDSAEQAWILGVGNFASDAISITDALRAHGPVFGRLYDKEDVERQPWGELSVSFSGPNNATVEYDGLDGAGSTQLIRLTNLAPDGTASSLPPGIAGAWFDPETDGQGWFVEILNATTALVYWFTYDENGNQAWNLGTGNIFGNSIVLPDNLAGTGTGFGAAFNADDIDLHPFSMLTMEFLDCASGTMSYLTADGQQTGSFPLQRLTLLDGYECGAIPTPSLAQSIMTNSTDPLISLYFGADRTRVGLFGKKSGTGSVDTLTSGFLQTPAEETINFEVDEQGQLIRIHDKGSGINLKAGIDANGDTLVVLNDPANNLSASTGTQSDAVSAKPKQGVSSTLSIALPAESGTEADAASESPSLVLQVETCGEAVEDAQVNFLVEDLSGSVERFAIPAVQSEPGTYVADLPTGLGSTLDDSTLDRNCSTAAAQFSRVCDFVAVGATGQGVTSGDCLLLGSQFAAINPDAAAAAAAVCATAGAAFSSACAANELRAEGCGSSVDKVYRDFSSVRVSAETAVPGLGINSISDSLVYDTPGTELVFPKLVLPGRPYLRGYSVEPAAPEAGENYTLELDLACVAEGQLVTIENTGNETSSSCNADAGGTCRAMITSKEWEVQNALEISSPEGLSLQLIQRLSTDTVAFWYWEPDYFQCVRDGTVIPVREAFAIERGVKLYQCVIVSRSECDETDPKPYIIERYMPWNAAVGYYSLGYTGIDIRDNQFCGYYGDPDLFHCDYGTVTRVGSWDEATEGDNGLCDDFP